MNNALELFNASLKPTNDGLHCVSYIRVASRKIIKT